MGLEEMKREANEIIFSLLEYSTEEIETFLKRPPLISSLQSFETSVLLMSIGRYPPALTVATAAIESAYKSKYKLGIEKIEELSIVLADIRQDLPRDYKIPCSLSGFRLKRNQITHFGYSKKDDEESLRFLIAGGFSMFDRWLSGSLGVRLIDALGADLAAHFRTAIALAPAPDSQTTGLSAVDAVRGVQRWIRYHIRQSFMTRRELDVLDEDASAGFTGFEAVGKRKDSLVDVFDRRGCSDVLTCPVCDHYEEALVVCFDYSSLETGSLEPVEAQCFNCDFLLPATARDLLRELVKKQLTDERLHKLRGAYGWESR
jgi:hypothetical protein